MGIIELENMEFHAYHGHFKEEQVVGNTFRVDVKIKTECTKAAISDDLEDALDYQHVYRIVKEQMIQPSALLEHVVKRILDAMYVAFPEMISMRVKLSKMNPPLGGQTDRVSVTMER